MDRYTDITGQLFACGNSICTTEPRQLCEDCLYQGKANIRLAAYEDTNRTPEQLAALVKAQDEGRLVELPESVDRAILFAKLISFVLEEKSVQSRWAFRQIRNGRTLEAYGLADAEKFLEGFFQCLIQTLAEAATKAALQKEVNPNV